MATAPTLLTLLGYEAVLVSFFTQALLLQPSSPAGFAGQNAQAPRLKLPKRSPISLYLRVFHNLSADRAFDPQAVLVAAL